MGLYDKLQQNIALGMNLSEPLFGGLIPRRVIENERPQQRTIVNSSLPSMPRPVDRIRPSGIDKVGKEISSNQPFGGRDVRFDWTEQELGLKNKALGLEGQKLEHEKAKEQREFGLKTREQERKELEDKNRLAIDKSKLDIDKDKQEIDHRKQALEEWKSRNPEGEVKELKDGKIVVVDKRSGKSIDTGLHSDHFNEEEKINLQHKNAMELEKERQKGRERLKTPSRINPSQQRTAERDAANEILNDPNYSWMEKKGYIVKEKDGSITINRPDKTKFKNENFTIDAFEAEVKKRSDERMNKTFNGSTDAGVPGNVNDPKTVEMIHSKTGEKLIVPEDEVEEARKNGAIMPGEETKKPTALDVDDSIELYYNDKGKVIGSRNRKNPSTSSFER